MSCLYLCVCVRFLLVVVSAIKASASRFDPQCLELDRQQRKKQHCGSMEAKASSFVLHAVGCEHLSARRMFTYCSEKAVGVNDARK